MTATYGYGHRQAREFLIRQARMSATPVICWRCETPITAADLATAECGHVVDAALMTPGVAPRYRLEHRACNREAGLALGRELARGDGLTRAGRNPSRAWVSTDLAMG